ncbi:flagellar assembly peptidoglycan hydrolase FlgJ [Mixta theicola]|uniref:Peptidoglycan hydrolase FlgJ n=1 Tax=Mixta theicola TaxID=1458355 RepID=A0A2K1Q861_9GAMM|nr:flagellar assembly peptidoglycan hydrolase FlgJ [Mixta theicola]PNS11208.1 flagellar assembly peptidoglycan hydrolase FlgJ [Mixta theicola]GLR07526.1 flagellar rod assembly protein/muramidase FlgJ [Mixta theicola]
MKSTSLIQGAAFDAGSLDTLKRLAQKDAQRGLQGAAQQMEGLFVQMMLKSMRAASFKDGLFNSQQSEMFTAMYDQQLAQDMAAHGKIGLADVMVQQMGGAPPASTTGGTPVAFSSRQLPTERTFFPPPVAKMAVSGGQSGVSAVGGGFISRLLAPAVEVSRRTGIPHQLIIAQAALESGWGNKEIRRENGQPSYNLFGIKATPDWKGETAEITTTEYINGVAKKVKAAFRVYHSYTDALHDYSALLVNNSRYKNVTLAKTPEQAAHALQDGGYATDPQYAKKLIGIMQQIKSNLTQAVNAYKIDLTSIF